MGSALGAVGGAVAGKLITGKGRSQASDLARSIIPKNIKTGFSSFDTKNGTIRMDPSIRGIQDQFLSTVGGLRDSVDPAFDEFGAGIEGLQTRSADMRADFEGNQSAFREATLRPVKQAIATRGGELDRELGRTGVRGSFGNAERSNFDLKSAESLSDTEARIENQRINTLGDFLNMDADLLKAGLGSETGRINLMTSLEESLKGVSMERFNQEMAQLRLPLEAQAGKIAGANIRGNAQGLDNQASVNLFGEVLGAAGDIWGTGGSGGNPVSGIGSRTGFGVGSIFTRNGAR